MYDFTTSFWKTEWTICFYDFSLNALWFYFKRSRNFNLHKDFAYLYHSHKKRKASLETRAKLAVLSTYVENQVTLGPILLYRASKHKQMKRPSYQDCLGTPILPSYVTNIRVFSFLCQDTNMPGSNFAKKMLQLFKEIN